MTKKSLKAQTLARIATVFGILVLLNIVSVRLFGRLDFTKNRVFSLAEASKELVRSLDDRVTVKAYFTEDLPAPYNNNRRILLDQLNEYKAYARGNLQYEFINPEGEKGEADAMQQGVVPVQVQVVKEDKFEVKRAYMGLVFLYEDRKEAIPVIQNTTTLEYDISSTIKRLISRGRRKIGFLTGQGEPQMSELSRVQELLQKQYEITSVDLAKGAAVPPEVSALIVMAPSTAFPEAQKFQLDQFLMRGGRIAFLLNRMDASLQNRFGRPLDVGLDDLLEAYGLRIAPDLVRDVQCANVSIVQQQYGFSIQSQVPFPYIPMISNVNRENPVVKDLQALVLFFASSVDTVGVAAKGLKGEILARTSAQSGRQSGTIVFDPLQRFTREEFQEKDIPVAAVVSGKFKSAYSGKPLPSDTSAGAVPPPANPLFSSPETRVLLVGDGDFVRDQFLGNRDNLTFFVNVVDYLVDDAGLITIRSKEVATPPLDQVSDAVKKILKYGSLIVPPFIVLLYGMLRWRLRKLQRKALEVQ
jgi:gliding-associated putative ABC transporter substrate-binding component GldG